MPRDRQLILGAYPCSRNFYSDGPQTAAELRSGDQVCPFYDHCPAEETRKRHIWCVMALGVIIARLAIERGRPVSWLVHNWLLPLIDRNVEPVRSFAWSPDRERLEHLTWNEDAKLVLETVRDFAVLTLEGSNDDPWAAYRIPAQAIEPGVDRQPVVAHRGDGKRELIFWEE